MLLFFKCRVLYVLREGALWQVGKQIITFGFTNEDTKDEKAHICYPFSWRLGHEKNL
jgi:hypothetical protein